MLYEVITSVITQSGSTHGIYPAFEGQKYFLRISLRPEPIPMEVKIILLGSYHLFHLLQNYDSKFNKIFKVRADFDHEVIKNDVITSYSIHYTKLYEFSSVETSFPPASQKRLTAVLPPLVSLTSRVINPSPLPAR